MLICKKEDSKPGSEVRHVKRIKSESLFQGSIFNIVLVFHSETFENYFLVILTSNCGLIVFKIKVFAEWYNFNKRTKIVQKNTD